jgi:hypothetical protein
VAVNCCVLPTVVEGAIGDRVIEVITGVEGVEELPPPQAANTSKVRIKMTRRNLGLTSVL